MSVFEYISVAVSIVMGLGLTQVLRSWVTAFRARREYPLDVLPLAWSGFVFLVIIQFWWAVFELDAAGLVREWSLVAFMLMLGLTVVLYLAAALMLPGVPTDLTEYADGDGRAAFVPLAGYFVLTVIMNVWMFGSGLFTTLHVLAYLAMAGIGWMLIGVRRGPRLAITASMYAFVLWALVTAAPTVYPS